MAYIYQIQNDVNHKAYVGKTNRSLEARFKEHCKEAMSQRVDNRPQYRAMQKYGVDSFHISQLEETNDPENRERHWIELLGSFKNGYNATKGGDGKSYADYDLIYALWNCGNNMKQISKLTGYDQQTIRSAQSNNSVSRDERHKRQVNSVSKPIVCLDADTNEVVAAYPSIMEAFRCLNKQPSGHIHQAATGKRKAAYGYKWKYL